MDYLIGNLGSNLQFIYEKVVQPLLYQNQKFWDHLSLRATMHTLEPLKAKN